MDTGNGHKDFLHKFRRQLYELVEFSYTADERVIGTLIHGNTRDFVNDTIEYEVYWPGFAKWRQMIFVFLKSTNPSSYLFKVDWKDNIAYKRTFYFRYMNGIPEEMIFNFLRSDDYEGLKDLLIPFSLKFGMPQPVSIGIRISADNSMPVSIYYDVSGKKKLEVEDMLSDVAEMMKWPPHAILEMLKKLQFMNKTGKAQYLAFGDDKVIKINYPQVSAADFFYTINLFNTDIVRQNEIKAICRRWKQPTLNYLGLKFNQEECGWKAYMVISQKHSGNHSYYNLNF